MKLNLKGINTATASITDYQMVKAGLARVIVAFTGKQTPAELTECLAKQLKYMAAPVENSFRILANNAMIGYVRVNQELRPTTDKEIRAGYKVMASNILMSNEDSTLWEVKTGAAGMFLARKGQEDLSELVSAAVNRRQDVPRLSQVVSASVAQPKEFVAYASDSGDMDYGFCTKASKDGTQIQVVSSTTGKAEIVAATQVASAVSVKIPRETHEKVVKAGIDRNVDGNQVEYYNRLFSYDPAYLSEVIRIVNESAAM